MAKSDFNLVLASRSQSKLDKVKTEIGIDHPNIKIKTVPIDLGKTIDYSSITSDKEVMQNLGMIVNNAGYLDSNKFLQQDPQAIQNITKLNTYAITLLSKYAKATFVEQK